MYILLLIICIIMIIAGAILYEKSRSDEGDFGAAAMIIIGAIGAVLFLVCMICTAEEVVNSRYIGEKISVYEEQNKEIEEDIDIMVENYMKFETETYGQFKSDNINGIAMVQLYPELKSDTLVQQQIQIYTQNNNKIKELKEKQIDYKAAKWWLYFGG